MTRFALAAQLTRANRINLIQGMVYAMAKELQYSAGMMSIPFLFIETKKTAELFLQGKSNKEAKQIVLEENLYQMQASYRAERYFNTIWRRLESISPELVKGLVEGDTPQAKLIVLLSIMRTDRLFFEFMYEAFRTELLVGSKELDDRVLNQFFAAKAVQSSVVAAWKDTTVRHLKQYYVRILFEVGYLSGIKHPRTLSKCWISDSVRKKILDADMQPYLNAMTGEA